jgi:hypothetical protein
MIVQVLRKAWLDNTYAKLWDTRLDTQHMDTYANLRILADPESQLFMVF